MLKSVVVAAGLLGGLATSGRAQQTASVAAPATRADSVQAIHSLFAKHRTGGWIWTTVGGLFAVRIATVAASSSSSGSLSSTAGGTMVGIGLFGGIPAGIGIGKLSRFSRAKEEQTVGLYEKTNILPPYVRSRLKKKYFN